MKRKAIVEKKPAKMSENIFVIKDEKMLDDTLEAQAIKKVTFGKVTFSGNNGPFIVAFEDNIVRNYAEMNARDFKPVHERDIKTETVPLWQCGAKTAEAINKLPKLNLKKHKEAAVKKGRGRKKS